MISSDFIKTVTDSLVKLHRTLGIKTIRKYIILGFIILGVLNIKTVTKGFVEFFIEVTEEIHEHKMKLRDNYMTDLTPMLAEFRAETGADRVLYFEYHNSEESVEGLPFKFFDLMLSNSRYGVTNITSSTYRNINASQYTSFFNAIKGGDILYCRGFHDSLFRQNYPGVYEQINELDHSGQQVYFSVPGLRQPIGFIAIEWMNDSTIIDVDTEIIPKIHDFVPRVNALLISSERN